jgi:predicted RNA-binding protein with PIN domain
MKIIVDGYNVIKTVPSLDQLVLKDARQELIRSLSQLSAKKKCSITIVFDAHSAELYQHMNSKPHRIKVLFTLPGETADSRIIDILKKSPHEYVVVSSDRGIAKEAERSNNVVIDSLTFHKSICTSKLDYGKPKEDTETDIDIKTMTKKVGPSKRLSKKARRRRKILRKLHHGIG